jgi:hypothetical protein
VQAVTIVAIAVLIGTLLLAGTSAMATTCIAGRSFKVRQVCGQVKDSTGVAIPDASVELTKKGESQAIFTEQSDSDVAQPLSVWRSKDDKTCSRPISVVMKVAGQCGYVENAWKKKDLH